MHAVARTESLIVRQFGTELTVYDEATHRLHELNPTAAGVWQQCDGQTSMEEFTRSIAGDSGIPEDEEVVRSALTQLSNAGLLEQKSGFGAHLSRRQLIRRLGSQEDAETRVPVVSTLVVGGAADFAAESRGPVSFGGLSGPDPGSVPTIPDGELRI